MMRLATYNVENMFARAKAMNRDKWEEGRPALEAHQELNTLFNYEVYSATDKNRMLVLLERGGLLNRDESAYLLLRKIRGKLLVRPTSGPVEIVAGGRRDWVGWVELKTEAVKETATLNSARVIRAVNADLLGVVEAENRTTLRLFNESVLPGVGAIRYDHVMLIDGNDDRGIDVGILTRSRYPIVSIRSHVDDADSTGRIFSRDCAEYEIDLGGGRSLWALVNHLKSKGYGKPSENDAKRKRQAKRIRKIYLAHRAAGHENVAIVGDFNDTPASDALSPLRAQKWRLRDVGEHPAFDNGGRPGTHGNCTASSKFDYIWLSPALFDRVQAGGIERRGMWGGTNGTLWPHFDEVQSDKDAASDHAAVWVDLDI
jgi:endonuclease/exonuclease/phosphatase family metal-dependent hydrolase